MIKLKGHQPHGYLVIAVAWLAFLAYIHQITWWLPILMFIGYTTIMMLISIWDWWRDNHDI